MNPLLFYFIILTNYLNGRCRTHLLPISKALLIFHSYPKRENRSNEVRISADLPDKYTLRYAYVFYGTTWDANSMNISSVGCIKPSDVFSLPSCPEEGPSEYFFVYFNGRPPIPSTVTDAFIILESLYRPATVLKIEAGNRQFQSFFNTFSMKNHSENTSAYITCTLEMLSQNSNGATPHSNVNSDIFGIIFFIISLVMTIVICFGWMCLVRCRRSGRRREREESDRALTRLTEQTLNRFPVIIFDSKERTENSTADHPMCSICLEAFLENQRIRKLICSHAFHTICLDPWLTIHQNCPLCNRDVLPNATIPTVSARITSASPTGTNDRTHTTTDSSSINL